MPSVSRTFTTTASPEAAYAYLADFRNAESWDPGTRTCERTGGDGGVGTTYRNVSSFLGREVEVTYRTAELAPPTRVHLRGTNEQFEGHDIFEIRAAGRGSEVTYRADMSFSGAARLAAPVVAAYLPILARKTVDQLRSCLDRQPG
jgi:carbon monoxide dehydrogenase subunit G